MFKIGLMFNTLTSLNNATAERAKLLYERTIDFGAHPNELALSQSLQMSENKDNIEFNVIYLILLTSKTLTSFISILSKTPNNRN